jgi:predicted transcriptional regulator of viral defense system
MRFDEFFDIYKDKPFIDSSTFPGYPENQGVLRIQISNWQKKQYLIKLKKSLYVFSEKYRKTEINNEFIANFLVYPSYISLEYALNFYNLIPERVFTVTSITTKKTQNYNNNFGFFSYRSIKKELFSGYEFIKIQNYNILIALKEKALIDYFYFNKNKFDENFEGFNEMRFQNLETLNMSKLKEFSKKFPKKVQETVNLFVRYARLEKKSYLS